MKKKRAIGDPQGVIERAELRQVFWRVLQAMKPTEVRALLALYPALSAINRWTAETPIYPETFDVVRRAVEGIKWPDLLPGNPDAFDDLLDESAEALGPLMEWPIHHVWDWCRDHKLDFPWFKADALFTVTTTLAAADWVDGPPGPCLIPEKLPTEVWVYEPSATLIAEELELKPTQWGNPVNYLFSKEAVGFICGEMGDLKVDRDEPLDVTKRKIRDLKWSLDWACQIALRRREEFLNEGRAPFEIPADQHFEWLILRRVDGLTTQEIAAAQRTEVHTNPTDERYVREVTSPLNRRLGFPPFPPGPRTGASRPRKTKNRSRFSRPVPRNDS